MPGLPAAGAVVGGATTDGGLIANGGFAAGGVGTGAVEVVTPTGSAAASVGAGEQAARSNARVATVAPMAGPATRPRENGLVFI